MADYPYNGPWPKLRRLILERDNHRCQVNGPHCTGTATHVDHIIPWETGGAPYDPANLRAACAPCNIGRAGSHARALALINTTPAPGPSRTW